MDSKKRVFLIIVVLALLVLGSSALYTKMSAGLEVQQMNTNTTDGAEQASDSPATQTALVPNFKMIDADGNETQLHAYLGKPIVLNFWASWCGPCQMEMPDFEEAFKAYGEEVNFLMVNMTDGARETVDIATEFIKEKAYTFPVFYDTAQEAAYAYSVYSLPTTYFIDADGTAVARAMGAIDAQTLQKGIDKIMK